MPVKDKFYFIQAHYQYLSKTFNKDSIAMIYETFNTILLSFSLDENNNVDITLCYIGSLSKEGELTLLITLNNQEFYSITFSFHSNGKNIELIICGIQGREMIENETIKFFTKKMHGVRPRNFLFFVLRQICKVLNVDTIKSVRSDYHVANCSHVKKTGKFKANYDQYWEEEGGVQQEKFYILSPKENRKDIENIPSKKRSMYKKRYAMLDEYQEIISNSLKNIII